MRKPPKLTDTQKAIVLGDKIPLATAAFRKHPQIFHFPPPRIGGELNDRMTILAGIIGKQVIMIGADSQWTISTTGTTVNADKISVVKFGSDDVLISQGGLRPITTDIIDRIKDASENVNIIRPRDVTQVINKAVQETKSSLGEDEATYGKTYGAALLIAFYAKGKPYIYTCNIFDTGVSEPAESHFTTIGIADPLANYLFCELSKRGDDDALQLAAMIYMILKVKENNAFCGGPTRIKLLKTFPDEMHTTGGRATEVDASFIKRAEEVLILRDQQSREERNRQMIAILREVASGFFKT